MGGGGDEEREGGEEGDTEKGKRMKGGGGGCYINMVGTLDPSLPHPQVLATTRVPASQITLYYYVGFSYLMMRRYKVREKKIQLQLRETLLMFRLVGLV